jgi:hypothetical protein
VLHSREGGEKVAALQSEQCGVSIRHVVGCTLGESFEELQGMRIMSTSKHAFVAHQHGRP